MNRITMTAITLTACALSPIASAQPMNHNDHAGHDHSGHIHYIDGPREDAAIPRPGVDLSRGSFALLVIDPQVDFLSPSGVTWGVVGESVTENNTVENIERLFEAAKGADARVFVSPPYHYPHDHAWKF